MLNIKNKYNWKSSHLTLHWPLCCTLLIYSFQLRSVFQQNYDLWPQFSQ